jgi:flagellar hook-associated protein 3
MIGRVTQFSMQAKTLQNLQMNLQRMSNLQEQLSSNKIINVPSDDPAGAVDVMRLKSDLRSNDQYQRNATNASSWLATIDSTLVSVSPQITRARNLMISATNGAMSQTQRDAIAAELDATAETLFDLANTTYMGRNIFAGTSAAANSYSVTETETDGETTRAYSFNGVEGSSVERRVGDSTMVRVDSDGSTVFGSGDGEGTLFGLINSVAAKLRNGEDVSGDLTKIDAYSTAVLKEAGTIGARSKQVSEAQTSLQDRDATLKTQLSSIEDVDLPAVIVELNMQSVAYNVALSVAGRTLQPTLLDYLQ